MIKESAKNVNVHDYMMDSELQDRIKADFDARMNGQKYVCPIPPEIGPRIPEKGNKQF